MSGSAAGRHELCDATTGKPGINVRRCLLSQWQRGYRARETTRGRPERGRHGEGKGTAHGRGRRRARPGRRVPARDFQDPAARRRPGSGALPRDRGRALRRAPARRGRHPGRGQEERAEAAGQRGGAGQGPVHPRQPAAGRVDRPPVRPFRDADARPDPGGQHRPSRPTRPGGSARRSAGRSPSRSGPCGCPYTLSRT
jgi:hypothetical protein